MFNRLMLLASVAGLLVMASSAGAQETRYKMKNADLSGELTLTPRADGTPAVTVEFRRPRCMGQISGTGAREGNRLIIQSSSPYVVPNAPKCVLLIDVQGSSLQVREQNCALEHGASCEATGTYVLTR
jgi:hypothetical protein